MALGCNGDITALFARSQVQLLQRLYLINDYLKILGSKCLDGVDIILEFCLLSIALRLLKKKLSLFLLLLKCFILVCHLKIQVL